MTNTLTWKTAIKKVAELKDLEENPRKITEQAFSKLKERIQKRGFHDVIKLDTDGIVLSGNQRRRALIDLGIEEVNVLIPDRALTKEERNAVIIESNRNDGIFDDDMLANLFDEQELRDLGFSEVELGLLSFDDPKEMDDDVVPEAPEIPQSKLGDIYLLGSHRLMCGDSTSKEDVAKLMDGAEADMVFTDPPYNVDYSGRGEDTSNKIMNDNMSKGEFDTFLSEVFKRYAEISKPTTPWYVFHSSSTQHQFQRAIEEATWNVKTQIIWNKPTASMGWGDYRYKHEPMFYCGKDKVNFYGDRTGTTVWDFQKDVEDLIKWAKTIQRADNEGLTTIWTMKREPVGGYVHPTQKPVELIERAIKNSSKNGEIVVDLFGGSGATLIACGKKGRKAYLMELDPKYVDVIVSRYCDYIQNWEITKNGKVITWKNDKKKPAKDN